jgi:hypothetical protein
VKSEQYAGLKAPLLLLRFAPEPELNIDKMSLERALVPGSFPSFPASGILLGCRGRCREAVAS